MIHNTRYACIISMNIIIYRYVTLIHSHQISQNINKTIILPRFIFCSIYIKIDWEGFEPLGGPPQPCSQFFMFFLPTHSQTFLSNPSNLMHQIYRHCMYLFLWVRMCVSYYYQHISMSIYYILEVWFVRKMGLLWIFKSLGVLRADKPCLLSTNFRERSCHNPNPHLVLKVAHRVRMTDARCDPMDMQCH